MYFYSLKPERKASAKCIKYFIERAIKEKEFALANPTNEWWKKYQTQSVKQIAHDLLEYARLRAFAGFVYGSWPIDKPASDLWNQLNNKGE